MQYSIVEPSSRKTVRRRRRHRRPCPRRRRRRRCRRHRRRRCVVAVGFCLMVCSLLGPIAFWAMQKAALGTGTPGSPRSGPLRPWVPNCRVAAEAGALGTGTPGFPPVRPSSGRPVCQRFLCAAAASQQFSGRKTQRSVSLEHAGPWQFPGFSTVTGSITVSTVPAQCLCHMPQ